MAKYYTKEEIQQAKDVDLVELLQRLGVPLKRHGRGYMLVDHDSLKLKGGSRWWWNSRDIGADNAVDYFVIGPGLNDVEYKFHEAVKLIRETMGYDRVNEISSIERKNSSWQKNKETKVLNPSNSSKPFMLPIKNYDNRRMSKYLNSRGIDYGIINKLINRGLIYEADKTHNAIFLGKDFNGNIKYACQRGTLTDKRFAGDIESSQKEYNFRIDGNNKTLRVFESPIDCVSYLTLHPNCKDTFLSLGGVSLPALEAYLSESGNEIKQIVVCTDNDKAGKGCYDKIASSYGATYIVTDDRPKHVKDYNDELLLKIGKGMER